MPSLNLDEIVEAVSEVKMDEDLQQKVIQAVSRALNNKKKSKEGEEKEKKPKKSWVVIEMNGHYYVVQYGQDESGNMFSGDPSKVIDSVMNDYNATKNASVKPIVIKEQALACLPAKMFKPYGVFLKSKSEAEFYSI